MNQIDQVEEYANIAVRLLQSDMDNEHQLWKDLLHHQIPLVEYFAKIGLELIIDKDNGFAFLRQLELDESGKTIALVRRMPLSFDVSMICVLLREWLDEYEVSDNLAPRLFITHRDLKERIEIFFHEQSNRVRFLRDLDSSINKVVDIGFLKTIQNVDTIDARRYQVKPILKAKISIEQLEEFKNQLEHYVNTI